MATERARELSYTVIFEPQPECGYTAWVPALPGCISEGDTLEEARINIREAIICYLESLLKDGEPIPEDIEAEPVTEKVTITLSGAHESTARR